MELKTLRMEDLNAVIELDKKITGEDHGEFFEEHFHSLLSRAENELMIGAFDKNRLIGFLLANVRQVAFGQHMKIAYLEMIEVDPEFQKSGVGSVLFQEFKKRLSNIGIRRVITIVDWRMTHLLSFFSAHGFKKGSMVQLEMNLDDYRS